MTAIDPNVQIEQEEQDFTEIVKGINEYNILEKYNQIQYEINDLRNKQQVIRDILKQVNSLFSFNNKVHEFKEYQQEVDFADTTYTSTTKEKFRKIYDDVHGYPYLMDSQRRFFVEKKDVEAKKAEVPYENTILFICDNEEEAEV